MTERVQKLIAAGGLCSRRTAETGVQQTLGQSQVRELSRTGEKAVLEVIIHQGKKRQIRRMCAQVGLEVARLKRVAEDGLTLGDLPCGHWRYLTGEELDIIKGSDRHE